jgi:thioredoxin-related protein
MNSLHFKAGFAIYIIVLWLGVSAAYASQDAPTLSISDLQQLAKTAKHNNMPILILFSIEGCEFCEFVVSEYLQPMRVIEEDRKRILIGEISIEDYNYVRDFNGQIISADKLGMRYAADFSPTVVFIDAQGNELAERIVGFIGRDYYDLALGKAIQQSIDQLTHNSLSLKN